MNKHKRIEITAFRRRLLVVSGNSIAEKDQTDVRVNNADSQETIETTSEEGQKILLNAIRILEENLQTQVSGG